MPSVAAFIPAAASVWDSDVLGNSDNEYFGSAGISKELDIGVIPPYLKFAAYNKL
jgi:hypothetical protein